jgi:GNAT superfamily N-acetyltransferase
VTAGVVVREARDEELDAAGAVVFDAYLSVGGDADRPYLRFVRDARGRAGVCPILVAVDDAGTVLGSATYVPDHENPFAEVQRPGEAGFRMLGVAPSARGRGIGEALVRGMIDRASAARRTALAISTGDDWMPARRLYERLGFERDPERDFDPVPEVHLIAYVLRI